MHGTQLWGMTPQCQEQLRHGILSSAGGFTAAVPSWLQKAVQAFDTSKSLRRRARRSCS